MPGLMKSCLKEVFTLVHTVTSVVRLMVELLLTCCRLVVLPRPMQYALPADSEALVSGTGVSSLLIQVHAHTAHALAVFCCHYTHREMHINNSQPIILSLIILHAALYGDYHDLSLQSISSTLPLPAHHLGGF